MQSEGRLKRRVTLTIKSITDTRKDWSGIFFIDNYDDFPKIEIRELGAALIWRLENGALIAKRHPEQNADQIRGILHNYMWATDNSLFVDTDKSPITILEAISLTDIDKKASLAYCYPDRVCEDYMAVAFELNEYCNAFVPGDELSVEERDKKELKAFANDRNTFYAEYRKNDELKKVNPIKVEEARSAYYQSNNNKRTRGRALIAAGIFMLFCIEAIDTAISNYIGLYIALSFCVLFAGVTLRLMARGESFSAPAYIDTPSFISANEHNRNLYGTFEISYERNDKAFCELLSQGIPQLSASQNIYLSISSKKPELAEIRIGLDRMTSDFNIFGYAIRKKNSKDDYYVIQAIDSEGRSVYEIANNTIKKELHFYK